MDFKYSLRRFPFFFYFIKNYLIEELIIMKISNYNKQVFKNVLNNAN